MQEIVAHIIGFIGAILMIASVQVKSKKVLYLLLNGLSGIFFTVNLIILGGYSGAFVTIIGSTVALITYFYNTKNKEMGKLMISSFIIITIIGSLITYTNIYSLLPLLAGLVYLLIITSKNMKNVRRLTIVQTTTWIIYDLIIHAYSPIISSLFALISSIIAMIRYDIPKREKSE